MQSKLLVRMMVLGATLGACKSPVDPLEAKITLEIVDEAGAPVKGAGVTTTGGKKLVTNGEGRVDIVTRTAALAVVTKPGHLDEPVVVGRGDDGNTVRVKLWNAGGKRYAMHSAGDVMFARRYQSPTEGAPLIPADAPEAGARHVVDAIRPIFAAADVRTVNLETVVSNMAPGEAYPGKRFILNSPPGTLAGLEALAVDAVGLANNHTRDFLDRGLDATLDVLGDLGMPHFGEAPTPTPIEPLVVNAGDSKVGFLGWTSVDGGFVNDAYPIDGQPIPADIVPEDMWQYEARTWGFEGPTLSVPSAARRIGSAWRLFKAAEGTMASTEIIDAWTSLSAVYPELQDWVQRRGHGGASEWRDADAIPRINALSKKVDLVVVQLHAGFQFQVAPSTAVRAMARAAIDAGAGIVVCHHPHVLQGVEWYRGKLIVYSLGNFVFDQDFATTFPSMFLRTVWDGSTLLEARLIPLELVRYRPTAVADAAALRTLRKVWEMSVMNAYSERDDQKVVRVFATSPDANTQVAQLRIERNTAVVTQTEPKREKKSLTVRAGAIEPLPSNGLVDPRMAMTPDLEVGRDLLGWGRFEDEHADGVDAGGTHWNLDSGSESAKFDLEAEDGVAYGRLSRTSENKGAVLTRSVARTPLAEHRLFENRNGVYFPLDPAPRYTIRFRARLSGGGTPSLRVDLYKFDDSDPTEDPSSLNLGRLEMPIDIKADGAWHQVEIPVDWMSEAGKANQFMPYVQLAKPASGKSDLDVDAFEVIEWRRADQMHDRFGVYNYVRNTGAQDKTFDVTIQTP
jgi:poly-gamma-glutamate capsule biosynthesis protein CapA/YwtB (metallophosphatase superfamily)